MTGLSDGESSILPFIPLILRGNSFYWPPRAVDALKSLSKGLGSSLVDSGETLFDFIVDIRHELGLQKEVDEQWQKSVGKGYAVFFDDLIPRADSRKWFGETIPCLANLMLRFPVILENHYKENSTNYRVCEGNSSDEKDSGEENGRSRVDTSLRILHSQRPGIVVLSQELIAALLACALFCLFPKAQRWKHELPVINFDGLFACISRAGEMQENKIKCIMHYFERVCNGMPSGVVSFERKVLPFKDNSFPIVYPKASFWSESRIPLCPFKVMETGTIEEHEEEALEVDFANAYLGGGALSIGCVQEEIRFMINTELIVGMLFFPAMQDNEAIEIVGAERFSKYEGYASGFRFAGDYVDTRCRDFCGRRETRIVAIDALGHPGQGQFRYQKLIREVNKAFCGFLDHAEIHGYFKFINKFGIDTEQHEWRGNYDRARCKSEIVGTVAMQQNVGGNNLGAEEDEECSGSDKNAISNRFSQQIEIAEPSVLRDELSNEIAQTRLGGENDGAQDICLHPPLNNIGIATGNWGCGAFGGDVELKSMLQWLAASQASRPFVLYFTFAHTFSERLVVFTEWIRCHGWTVGELWGMLMEYSSQRLQGNMYACFFEWVLPRINRGANMVSMKKSKKERKVSKKRSADAYNNGDDDENVFSPDASLSPVSHMDWSPPSDSGSSEGSGNVSPANEMVADGKVELTSLRCPATVQPGISTERPVLDDANAVLPSEGSAVEIEIKNESSNSSSVPKFSQPMNSNSQNEGQRNIAMQAIPGVHFEASQVLQERTIGQKLFHSQFNAQMPHSELFSRERYSDSFPQVSHLRPNISLVRNGAVSSGYATPFNRASTLSPSFSLSMSPPLSTPYGARLPPSSISSAGFFPSRVPFHNAAASLGFTSRDISLQRIQAHMLQVQQRESQARVPSHDLLRYNNGFCNWVPAVTVRGDQQHSICEVCYDCKRRNINPIPFHWCVQDRIIFGFRGPSPAGPIERPGKRRVQVAV